MKKFLSNLVETVVAKTRGRGRGLGRSVFFSLFFFVSTFVVILLGPVVQKPINANPRLKINQGVYFPTPKCYSTLIFGKTLH